MCERNTTCEGVECGGGYCSWWKNDKCNDPHDFSDDPPGMYQTCIKISGIKGRHRSFKIYFVLD